MTSEVGPIMALIAPSPLYLHQRVYFQFKKLWPIQTQS
jgi:hypothetical protein